MTVSFKLRPGDLILVPVRLRHRKGCRRDMLLDTGARRTLVHPDLAGEIGLDVRDVSGLEVIGVAGPAPASMATIDAVSLFGLTVRDLEVVCFPIHRRLGFQGILGMNFLRHFNFTVDNDSEAITFELRRE